LSRRAGREERLSGRVALVTGGARRIGRAIVLALAREGARVAVHYNRSRAEAEVTAREAGGGAGVFGADLQSVGEIRRLARDVEESMGVVDILVNSAALFARTPFLETSEEDWDRFHAVNVKAVFFLSQTVARSMQQGSIIHIGDTGGVHLWPGYLAYGASKAAVIALTRGMAKALAPDIRVNAVLPGPMLPPEAKGTETIEEAIGKTLHQRQGSAEDVALAVRYLLTDGSYVTGAVIPVDGGRLAAGH
jgi:NAD(P)-dependent dehydrogenase (short-subunit alcohol dehydrogenase family)